MKRNTIWCAFDYALVWGLKAFLVAAICEGHLADPVSESQVPSTTVTPVRTSHTSHNCETKVALECFNSK
jgi:hypothetical protein